MKEMKQGKDEGGFSNCIIYNNECFERGIKLLNEKDREIMMPFIIEYKLGMI